MTVSGRSAVLYNSLEDRMNCSKYLTTSSNQRLGECVRPKMESQVVAKEQGCWQTMQFNMPQMGLAMGMSERGISPHNILEERLRDEPKEHLSAK